MSVLDKAQEILSKGDKEHQYGSHLDTMPKLAEILTVISGKT